MAFISFFYLSRPMWRSDLVYGTSKAVKTKVLAGELGLGTLCAFFQYTKLLKLFMGAVLNYSPLDFSLKVNKAVSTSSG